MFNYFWAANGKYTSNIIEQLSIANNNFNVGDDRICIEDTCLTKNEISQLKELLPGFNIIKRSPILEKLTEYEVRLYLKEILEKINKASNDTEKNDIFNEFFIYGLYDPRSADKLSFNEFYLQSIDDNDLIDFQNILLNLDSIGINNITLPSSIIMQAIETNNIKESNKLIFSLSFNDVQNIGTYIYHLVYNTYTIQLVKLTILGNPKWKIVLYTNNLLNTMYIKQDEIFNEKFKSYLNTIDYYNKNNTIELTEYRYYIDNVRAISLLDGKFNIDIFKSNIFTNFYKKTIDISNLTDDDIMSKIYNPLLFERKSITLLQDEKSYLGYYELHDIYILIEESEEIEIRLIYGKKNSTDNYKWMLVYIKKE